MAIHTYKYTHIRTYRERNREREGGETYASSNPMFSRQATHIA